HIDVDWQAGRFLRHQPHALDAEDIGDFVRVDEHRGGAVRDDGAGELGDRDHAALDVHVGITEAGDEVAAGGIDHLRALAAAIVEILADGGKAAAGDGDVGAGNDFAGVDVHPAAVADEGVGRGAAHG